jgi:hypothetical protein
MHCKMKDGSELSQWTLHSMLDIALKLLPELATAETLVEDDPSSLRKRLDRCRLLSQSLQEWEQELWTQHAGALYLVQPAAWDSL